MNKKMYTITIPNFEYFNPKPKLSYRRDVASSISAAINCADCTVIGTRALQNINKFSDNFIQRVCDNDADVNAFMKNIGINRQLTEHEVVLKYTVRYFSLYGEDDIEYVFCYWNVRNNEFIMGCFNDKLLKLQDTVDVAARHIYKIINKNIKRSQVTSMLGIFKDEFLKLDKKERSNVINGALIIVTFLILIGMIIF